MTGEQERTAKVPPRVFVRTAWVLHRAFLRFTGGRIGLRPPGKAFGMLRLERSGGARASPEWPSWGTSRTARTWSRWP